jgi:hypothetical protein
MKIIRKYYKDFVLRGLVGMGFGPIVLAIVYGILGVVDVVESVSIGEMALGVLTITALAFLVGGITVVFQIEEIGLSMAITAHGVILYLAYAVVYITNNWLKDGIIPFLIFTAIFVIGYALVWIVIYYITKRSTDKINQNMKS